MAAKFRPPEERPTREMNPAELVGLLSEAELATARRKRATMQPAPGEDSPLTVHVEHSPLPSQLPNDDLGGIPEEPEAEPDESAEMFTLDTRELDARVFRKHALSLHKSGAMRAAVVAPMAPTSSEPPEVMTRAAEEPTELVAPIGLPRSRIALYTLVISVIVTSLVLLFLALNK